MCVCVCIYLYISLDISDVSYTIDDEDKVLTSSFVFAFSNGRVYTSNNCRLFIIYIMNRSVSTFQVLRATRRVTCFS